MTQSDLSGFPYIEVEINKSGTIHDSGDLQRVKDFLDTNHITDLAMISHGWNNDTAEAQSLYQRLFDSVRSVADGSPYLSGRKLGVLGIFWPSKKFTEADLIPGGGAAGLGSEHAKEDVAHSLDQFAELLDEPKASSDIAEIRGAIENLDSDPVARQLFADKIRSLLPQSHAHSEDGSDLFFDATAEELFDRLEAPFLPTSPVDEDGGAAGGVDEIGAAGLFSDMSSGAKAAARRVLNYATYYVMKARAGDVGSRGLKTLVMTVKQHARATKVHLIGHSFGGRVVTAASKSLGDAAGPNLSSMSLLQAAFSHNGFAESYHNGENGYFRNVLANAVVHGPVLVTHTHNDRANAIAYPLASRLARQDAAGLGGPGDRFGAIGANGAQCTPEAQSGTLLAVGSTGYSFQAGQLYNLRADEYIADHGNVAGREVAFAILSAIEAT